MLKCTKINFGWGSAPDPAGGAYSAPPDPLAGFKGPTSKGREGREEKGGKGVGERRGMGGEGRKRRGGWEGRGRGGRGKRRGCGRARKVVCPGARAGSRRAWLKLTADRHEASRGLFGTLELLVEEKIQTQDENSVDSGHQQHFSTSLGVRLSPRSVSRVVVKVQHHPETH